MHNLTVHYSSFALHAPYREKQWLRMAADQEHRSIANMIEGTIRDYCGQNDIIIPEHGVLIHDNQNNYE
jgi:hypothetical protein